MVSQLAEQSVEFIRMYRAATCLRQRNKLLPDENGKRFLESKRTIRTSDGDFLMQVLQRILANVLSRSIADHQQLCGRNASPSNARQQMLSHYRRQ